MDSVTVHDVFNEQFDSSTADEIQFRDHLIAAFKYWAQYGTHPDFGRDASYRDPEGSVVPKAGLRHVHLRPEEPGTASERRIWDDPHAEAYRKTSNRHLVYVKSDEGDRLILYYFAQDAHEGSRADQYRFLKALGRAAQEWFDEESLYPHIDG